MEQAFLVAAMKVLLDMPGIIPPERSVLNDLLRGAETGIEGYDNTLTAFRANAFISLIIHNIITKGRAAGLAPILENLRHAMEDRQGDPEPHVSGAPVAEEAPRQAEVVGGE